MVFTRNKQFYRNLFLLAIPVALQNFITFAVGLADNVMVSSLSDTAVSGVYIGNQLQTVLQMLSGGIEGALLILSAQYWGKKDTASIRKIAAVGLRISLFAGLGLMLLCLVLPRPILSLLTNQQEVIEAGTQFLMIVCLSYPFFCLTQAMIASMRAVEKAMIGLFVSTVSLVVNIGMNYILIFGLGPIPKMGIRGAALATLISRIVETLVMLIYVLRVDDRLKMKIRDLSGWDKTLASDFVKVGAPIMGGQIVWSVNLFAQTAIMGRYDQSVIAAVSIANTLSNLGYVTMNGMSSAVGIITGKTVGAGKKELMKEYAVTVQVIFLILGLLTGTVFALLRGLFIQMYSGVTPMAKEYAMQLMTVICVTFIGTCYQCACLFGLVKSGGDVGFVFKNDTIFVFGVVLPSAIIAHVLGAPVWVVYACLKCDQILKCIVAFFKIRTYNWMKNLTRDVNQN